MSIARRLGPLACTFLFALVAGPAPIAPATSSADEIHAADTSAADGAAVAPGDSAGDAANCGMGEGGSCCQACQQREKFIKEGKAKDTGGGCPCQRARELREKH